METWIVTVAKQNVVSPMPYKTCEFSPLICPSHQCYDIELCPYNKNIYLYESTRP